MKPLVIANPTAASGAVGRSWTRLAAAIREQLGPFDHRLTTQPAEATRITKQALSSHSHDLVVAMGGDGTLSEVVDGFFTTEGPIWPNATLGFLPMGTGGDFRRTIKAPTSLVQAAASLRGSEARAIDVGRLNYVTHSGANKVRHFINIASFGIGGLVDQLVGRTTKMFGGRIAFALATLRAMRRFRPQTALIRLDDGEPRPFELHAVAVANGQYFGGGMHIAPTARLDNGQFDVVLLGPLSLGDILWRMHRVYRGTHLNLPQVTHARARRVQAAALHANETILLDVDGEAPGRLPATFELMPRAIKIKQS